MPYKDPAKRREYNAAWMRARRARRKAEREAQVEAEAKRAALFHDETLDKLMSLLLDFDPEPLERMFRETDDALERVFDDLLAFPPKSHTNKKARRGT